MNFHDEKKGGELILALRRLRFDQIYQAPPEIHWAISIV